MELFPKCDECKVRFKTGDKLVVIGDFPSFFTAYKIWPGLYNAKKYHESCFNKKFKKK